MDCRRIIEENYGIKINGMRLLDSHFGTDLYLAETEKGKFVVKTLPTYMENAKNEGAVTEFVSGKGIKTARFLKTRLNKYSLLAGERIVTVQEFIEGKAFGLNCAPDWFMDQSAELLGRIHTVLDGYGGLPLRFGKDFFTADNALQKKFEYEKELAAAEADTALLFTGQLKHLKRIGEFCMDTSKLTYANSHGDYHIGQAIVKDKEITVIDWSSACRLPVCLELATSFAFASPKCKGGEIDADGLKRYVERYSRHFSLSDYDIKMMPYVLYFWHCMCNYYPGEEIPENYKPVADLTRDLLNWLYEHSEELSAGLCG